MTSGSLRATPAHGRGGRTVAQANAVLTALARHAWFVEDEVLGLGEVVRPGDVCIDVGAEYGLYTLALAHHVGPEGLVHSIEPHPGALRVLTAAVSLARGGNVRTHQHALGEQHAQGWMSVPWRGGMPVHGRGFLTTGIDEPGVNATDFRFFRWLQVQVTTLDEFCARESVDRVDFIKADVEGAELKVLRGGEATIAEHLPAIQLEIQSPHLAKYGERTAHVVDWLTQRGYIMHVWRDGAWRAAAAVDEDHRNYLFVARDDQRPG